LTITPLIGPYGKFPILIRDDDTNFFTKSNMLEIIYSKAWDNNFKVSISVIPYQKAIKDVCIPSDARNSQEYYSVENNKEICSFLKDKVNHNNIEIIQHGVSHALIDGRGEFSKNIDANRNNINRIINDTFTHYYSSRDNTSSETNNKIDFKSYVDIGRNILKKSLGITPTFFAPPFDDFSANNLNLISSLGMVPIYGQSNYHRFFRSPYIPNQIKKYVADKFIKKFANMGFIIPFIMSNADYNNNNKNNQGIVLHVPKRPKLDLISNNDKKQEDEYEDRKEGETSQTFVKWVSNTISSCIAQRTSICILNHYHHYFYDWNYEYITRKNLFEQWQQILNLLDKIPFSWKTTFIDIHQRISKIKKINISKTGQKITIKSSDELLEDISFKVNRELNLEKKENLVYDEQDKTIVTINQLKPNSTSIFYLR